jgi:SAM-dependent methyltransferase
MPLAWEFISNMKRIFAANFLKQSDIICDIGNQGKNLSEFSGFEVQTLDISESSCPDIVADITKTNEHISPESFDALICTEVLEHVVDPFSAVRELRRMVRIGGYILVTVPLNTRIHGPIPDCWRFTEFGLKVLLRDFDWVYFRKLDTPGRSLFPLHYGIIVRNIYPPNQNTDPRDLVFSPVN